MKQIVATAQTLELVEAQEPQPGAGQFLIDVAASGVGLVDLLMRQAVGADSFVPGIEVAGTLTRAGPGMPTSLIGTRVFARIAHGGYADKVVADEADLIPLPDALNAAAAVSIGVNALVAHFALQRAAARAGERLLVRGAGGGIGVMAVQLAAELDAKVTASSRGAHSKRLRTLGNCNVVDAEATGAGEFDVIIDLVAGRDVEQFIARLAPNGRYVLAGIAGGIPPEDFGRALVAGFRRTLSVSTFSLDTVPRPSIRNVASQLFARAATGQLSAIIDLELPLAEAQRAHTRLSNGEVFGKLVLRPH